MAAATAVAAAWVGYMPADADQGTVRVFAYIIFFVCLTIVLFGGKIYNALEKVQLVMVVWIIGYLLIIDIFMVSPKVWWTVIKGFFSFGALPSADEGGDGIDWLLLGAFAAFAGSGGLGNITITNYVRDKGWGMSKTRWRHTVDNRRAEGDAVASRQGVPHHPGKRETIPRMVEV